MPSALITGITGQDGSYLAEILLDKGYRVIGGVRDLNTAEKRLFELLNVKFTQTEVELVEWDMQSPQRMVEILSHYQPDEIYNFAAFSSGSGMFDDAAEIGKVNGMGITYILEAIRQVNEKIRFCQASSSEMFGQADVSPQSEISRFNPRSPYGAAKVYAHNMIGIYRQSYNVFACSAILFNHESPRRGSGFVPRKITQGVAKIKLGLAESLTLGDLDACRDWGFAGDYVLAMHKMLQQDRSGDYVVSSGQVHSVRQFCEMAFSYVGLNYRDFVKQDSKFIRPAEKVQLVGDNRKACQQLDWKPECSFKRLVTMMVEQDLALLSQEEQRPINYD